jgi:hypothetical protein
VVLEENQELICGLKPIVEVAAAVAPRFNAVFFEYARS